MNTLPRDQRQSGQIRNGCRHVKCERLGTPIEYHPCNRLSNNFWLIDFLASPQGRYFGVEQTDQEV